MAEVSAEQPAAPPQEPVEEVAAASPEAVSNPVMSTQTPRQMSRFDPGRKAKTFSRTPQFAAEMRFHKPNLKADAFEVDLLKKNSTFVHSAAPLKIPVPQIVNHHADKVYGTNDADCHSANTNPGFSRNPLGGFYTQIR
jgi:hypothetical protein